MTVWQKLDQPLTDGQTSTAARPRGPMGKVWSEPRKFNTSVWAANRNDVFFVDAGNNRMKKDQTSHASDI